MRNVHLMGIGGIGMSALAELFLKSGDKVSGCDSKLNHITKRLENKGALIHEKHSSAHINDDIDLLIYSSAIKPDNPEFLAAKGRGVSIMKRAEALAELVKDKDLIAVTGTHGKTTTSFMIEHCLDYAGINPGFAIGGETGLDGSNARWTDSRYFVAEADESDGTHLCFKPFGAVITNIDSDHMEHYEVLSHIVEAMRKFVGNIRPEGMLFACGEDPEVKKILKDAKCEKFSYGLEKGNDIYATDIEFFPRHSSFNFVYEGVTEGKVIVSIPGRHNILNSLACIGMCMRLEIPFNTIAEAMANYPGVKRRLEILIERDGITVMDDYAHHPNEIKNVVETVKKMSKGRCIGVFQPHRFTRTKFLKSHFGNCFDGLDKLFLTDIYSAGEKAIEGVSGMLVYEEVKKYGSTKPQYIESKNDIIKNVLPDLIEGDTVVFMGAGDITDIANNMKMTIMDGVEK